MTGKTHLAGGMAATGLAMLAAQPAWQLTTVACVAAALVGSLFPDVDLRTSKAGRAAGFASTLIQHIIGHRTLFHSPILYVCIYLCIRFFAYAWMQPFCHAFLLGVGSHLLLDLFNKKGIPLFYPYTKRFHLACIRINSFGERVICYTLYVVVFLTGIVLALQFFR